ncbi:hypothetical protein Peur_072496 [Populus x canadensis]
MQGAMSFHQFLACHELYSSTSSPIDELRRDTTIKNVSKDALQGKLGKMYIPDQKVSRHLVILNVCVGKGETGPVLDVASFAQV